MILLMLCTIQELPPRARRIPVVSFLVVSIGGTTSACAENTWCIGNPYDSGGNYLRVRGEYITTASESMRTPELPPRARRIQVFHHSAANGEELPPRARRIRRATFSGPAVLGTTSACAENTQKSARNLRLPGNYLRVRGEYRLAGCGFPDQGELPPRARRIRPCRVFRKR